MTVLFLYYGILTELLLYFCTTTVPLLYCTTVPLLYYYCTTGQYQASDLVDSGGECRSEEQVFNMKGF